MSEVTAPIMTDATGQSIDSKLNSLLTKMDNLAAAFQPNASGIVYSNTTSGLTGDDVQEAIDEVAGDITEINSALSLLQGQLQDQVTDLNTPLNNGCALITLNTYPASASNKPTANSGIIMSFGTGRFRQQIAFELAGAIYTRYYDNGTFTTWTQRG